MNHKSDVTIFTDGSSRGNPGPGGYAAVLILPTPNKQNSEVRSMHYEVREIGGREERTTNNRMELQAAISALSLIHTSEFIIHVYTDSSYLVNGITRWIHGWQRNGWKTKEKKDVENRDLWEELIEAARGKSIEWKQIGGHVGVAGNMRCDEIATAFADGLAPKLYADVLENYSIKNILDIKEDVLLSDKKDSSRAHSNAKAYSYVSLVDGVIQTHKTWAECEVRVKGKKAKYKKVLSAEEETELIEEWGK